MKMITLSQCLALCDEQSWAESTHDYYRRDIRYFADYWVTENRQEFDLSKVSNRDLRAYQDYLRDERGLRANSIQRKFAPLRFFFKTALKKGWLAQNPMGGIKLTQQTASAPRWLDKNEQAALMRAIQQELEFATHHYPARWRTYRRDASLTVFLLNTGARVQEACDVRLTDLQLSERKGSVLLIRRGRGGAKEQRIPLNAHARKALYEWLAVRLESDSDYLWTVVEGNSAAATSNRSVQRILARYKKLATLEHFSPYVCRHTFAKNLIDEGVGLEKVAKLLGHAKLNSMKAYITFDEQDLALAVEKLR